MRLIFATNNQHKMSEIKEILGEKYKDFIFSLGDLNVKTNPVESGKTYIENADIKARTAYDELLKLNILKDGDYVIADDTGLSIDYLGGAPGIMSARYMGKDTSQSEKNRHILDIMSNTSDSDRKAHFTTALSLIEYNKNVINFVGRIDGYIARKIEKTGGFGYDPIFAVGDTSDIAKGEVKTFSNIGNDGKNAISHRARALFKMVEYLEKHHKI